MLVRTAAIAIERDRNRDQTALLLRELSHRVKNVLAVVQAIATSTLRSHVDPDRLGDFEPRLVALARTQTLRTRPQPGALGRASGRERVCRNVSISVFAGSLNKTK